MGISPGTERTDGLELLGLRGSRIDLLRYLAVHPGERVHLRRLEQLFGQKSASFQRDLRALVELGALRRVHGAPNRVEYELVASWPSWPTIRSLLSAYHAALSVARRFTSSLGARSTIDYASYSATSGSAIVARSTRR